MMCNIIKILWYHKPVVYFCHNEASQVFVFQEVLKSYWRRLFKKYLRRLQEFFKSFSSRRLFAVIMNSNFKIYFYPDLKILPYLDDQMISSKKVLSINIGTSVKLCGGSFLEIHSILLSLQNFHKYLRSPSSLILHWIGAKSKPFSNYLASF